MPMVQGERSTMSAAEKLRFGKLKEDARKVCLQSMEMTREAAKIVRELHDSKLWRDEYPSWSVFCRDFLKISRSYSHQLITWDQVIDDVTDWEFDSESDAPIGPQPTQRHARALAPLGREDRKEAWDRAVVGAEAGEPTLAEVKDAVAAVRRQTIKPGENEPKDVKREREKGIIPANAEVLDVYQEGEDDDSGETDEDAEPELTDEEWLDTLPARKDLSTKARRWFDAEALAYRNITEPRDRYRDAARPVIADAKRSGKHIGPLALAHDAYLRMKDPSRWIACRHCGGTGEFSVIGKCPQCRGHAYLIRDIYEVTEEGTDADRL